MVQAPTNALLTAVSALQQLDDRSPRPAGEVVLRRNNGEARLLLCNPKAHNALTIHMMRQLSEAVLDLHSFDGSSVILASEHGGTFCSGGHLKQVREVLIQPDVAQIMTRSMAAVLDALLALPMVSIAVIEGAAIGGGAELVTACDLRVATPDARVHFVQSALGVAAGWGGARRLVQHVSRASAVQLLVGARSVGAQQALTMGLVQHVGAGSVEDLVAAVIGDLSTRDVAAVRAAKLQVAGARDPQIQADAFLSVWGAAAHRRSLGL